EVRDALAWLRILADPLDGQAVARLCASPACGLSDATAVELAAGLEDDDTAFARRIFVDPLPPTLDADSRTRIERLRKIVDALEPYSAAALQLALPAVFAQSGIVAAYAESGDRQALANLRKLRELASDYQDRNREAQARDFVRYIDEIGRVDFDDREADWPATDAVTIMTVHAAKGLEWPVVFVIDVWPPKKPQPLIWLDHESGALLCREGRDDAPLFHVSHWLWRPDDDGFIPHEDDVDGGPSAEERRLFYVALTRARDEVHVLGPRRYSASNPDGVPNPFMRETEAWIQAQGWVADEPSPPAGAGARQLKLAMDVSSSAPETETYESYPAQLQPIAHALPPLSYSVLHAYERCPRSVTYRAVMRLPELRRGPSEELDDALADAASLDAAEPGALLAAGDFGRLVHRALERWARGRIASAVDVEGSALVDQAAAELQLCPKNAERARAVASVEATMAALADWDVLRAEAPFTLQYGDIVVAGYIDLIARDPRGRATIVDYKTGVTKSSAYSLQLAIYRDAADRVYGLSGAACAIGRFDGERFALEPLDVPSDSDVRERIASVAAGLRLADVTARPGEWCWTCPYRAAPCDAYR
ncbi:MAG: PD-(D/E)XK nuclease family protein, partial [Candidatus Eremiobacteraeota bacterium]|nr:PD-(D/E)XK nuclease family protein [Candidatus Eremiobacteraeota bacterium]